jgi:L-lactate dehydrogenase complex protein LldE
VLERESPQGKPVSLFVTCLVDMLYPETGMSVVKVLEHVGVAVDFPMAQTCCGQPAYNSGYHGPARQVAAQFLRAFAEAEVIVTPSGSCAAMVRHEYPRLFADNPAQRAAAERLAAITWEFSEFLVDGLGISDLGAVLPQTTTFAFHDTCHGLRLLGLGAAGRQLIGHVTNASLIEMEEHDVCCGFGGLFAVKMADVSGAMLAKKVACITACPAQVLGLDVSCQMHINGGLEKAGSDRRLRHVADVLAEAMTG